MAIGETVKKNFEEFRPKGNYNLNFIKNNRIYFLKFDK